MDTPRAVMMKTGDLLGSDVFDGSGHKIASIRELFIDPASGRIEFAIIEIAALLGSGGKYHPVPWGVLSWNAGRPGYDAPFDKDRLKTAPSYDRDQINSTAYSWDTQVRSFYVV